MVVMVFLQWNNSCKASYYTRENVCIWKSRPEGSRFPWDGRVSTQLSRVVRKEFLITSSELSEGLFQKYFQFPVTEHAELFSALDLSTSSSQRGTCPPGLSHGCLLQLSGQWPSPYGGLGCFAPSLHPSLFGKRGILFSSRVPFLPHFQACGLGGMAWVNKPLPWPWPRWSVQGRA